MKRFKRFVFEEVVSEILNEMSVYDDKYPVGTILSPSSASSNLESLVRAGLPVTKDSVLTKTSETDDAKLVSLGTEKVSVFLELDGQVYKVIGSRSNISKYFNKKSMKGGIPWGENTLEVAACLGLFFDAEIEYEKILNKNTPISEDGKILSKIESVLTSNADFNEEGRAIILKAIRDKESVNLSDLVEILRLAGGVSVFKKTLPSDFKYIIHNKIDQFYQAEKENPQIDKLGSKLPTPDAIFSNKSAEEVIAKLRVEKVSFDEKTGICELPGGIRFVNVSLKKKLGGAQLGKIYKGIKDRYGLSEFDDMLNVALAEGWFSDALGKAKNIGVKVFDSIKTVFNKLVSKLFSFNTFLKNSLVNRMNQSPENDLQNLFREAGIKKSLREDFLIEAKRNVVPILDNLSPEELKKVTNIIDSRLKKIKTASSKNSHIAFVGDIGLRVSGNETLDEKVKLFANWISIVSLENIFSTKNMSNVSSLAREIVELQKEMFFGSTNMPVFKVYGLSGTKTPYEYLGSGSQFIDKKMQTLSSSKLPLIGISCSSQGGKYYALYSHFCMGIDENGELEYSENRMGTNKAGGVLAYTFEGYKIINYEEFSRKYQG